LVHVNLWATDVSTNAVKKLKKALPNCTIIGPGS